jgi:malate synthase
VFNEAESRMNLPRGTIKATVLIETLPAAFEMDEILYELRDHSAGLNCGRWDYIFSCIKKLRKGDFVFADRALVTMTSPFLRAYCQLLVKTCHRRNAHAMGGMARRSRSRAMRRERCGYREGRLGQGARGERRLRRHLGRASGPRRCREAGLRPHHARAEPARREARGRVREGRRPPRVRPQSPITEKGLRTNISVCLQYVGSWLAGNGCVPINHFMETRRPPRSRARRSGSGFRSPKGVLEDGRKVTMELFRTLLAEELRTLNGAQRCERHSLRRRRMAARPLVESDEFIDFLTEPAYEFVAALPEAQEPR